jgi:hypothetical protein
MLEGLSAKTYANVISMILPSGWQVLCDHFRKTYSADLPFVHFPTFLEFSTRIQHAIYTHDLNSSADKLDGLTFDSKVLLLSFLALTLRHCGVDFDKHKSIEGRDHDNLELSAQCARLALLSLANCSLRRHDETIRSVRARLMLAAYQWSVCWCTKARYLLSEAYLVGQEMNIVQEPCERHAQEPISVAMSFEAELLGVTVAQDVSHDRYLESDLETETVRRTFWSCHLLDLLFFLGTSRSLLISCGTETFPPMPASEEYFLFKGSSSDSPWSQRDCITETVDIGMNYPQQPASASLQSTPTTRCLQTPPINVTTGLESNSNPTPLNYYVRWLSLLR